MKKILTLILTVFIILPNSAKAIGTGGNLGEDNKACLKQENCFNLCSYKAKSNSSKSVEIKIYYILNKENDIHQEDFYIEYGNSSTNPQTVADKRALSMIKDAQCPKYAYYDTDWINEICITDTEGGCDDVGGSGTDFSGSTSVLTLNHLEKVSEVANDIVNYSCDKLYDNEDNVENYLKEGIFDILNEKVYFGKGVPDFLKGNEEKNIKGSSAFSKIVTEGGNNYKKFFASCLDDEKESLDEQLRRGEITQEEHDKKVEELEERQKNVNKAVDSIKTYFTNSPNIKVDINVDASGCGLISDEFREFLQWVIDTIRIAGLVAAIVLGIIDYAKASFGSREDGMKTANKNFATRLMALGILLLVPTIINLALALFDIGIYGNEADVTCGIK